MLHDLYIVPEIIVLNMLNKTKKDDNLGHSSYVVSFKLCWLDAPSKERERERERERKKKTRRERERRRDECEDQNKKT